MPELSTPKAKPAYEAPEVLASYTKDEVEAAARPRGQDPRDGDQNGTGCGCGCGCA